MTPHERLKEATAAVHDRVDARFAAYDLTDRDQYRAFLVAHATAYWPVESALRDGGIDRLFPIDGRGSALAADLAELDAEEPPLTRAPTLTGPARLLGAAYVLEGSRLGGAVLAKQVPDGFPVRFLAGENPGPRWASFVRFLNRSLAAPSDLADATDAALGTFALFETGGAGKPSE